MRSIELIDKIHQSLNKKNRLINNLHRIIGIASEFNHQDIIDWVNKELYGYEQEDNIPPYRKIEYIVYKEETLIIEERSYYESNFWFRPIKEVIKNSKKKSSLYSNENLWGTPLTIRIEKSKFNQIIEGVISNIKSYLSKIFKEQNIEIEQDKKLKKYKIKRAVEILDLEISELKDYTKNDKEKRIFKENLESLLKFEYDCNFKYCMIAMGSIIEFLLIKYCKAKNISPEPYDNRKGKSFANFIEAAIKNDIFGEKSRWQIIQSHFRDFRNYVHILKEIGSTEIDQKWYKTMKPIFEALYDMFKKTTI